MNTAVRFGFGENWQDFAAGVDTRRLEVAGQSLDRLLDKAPLDGRTFLDIGCGSGLFSLAAAKRGAIVKSFDFDANSVACTRNLRSLFFPHSANWEIEQGSILDRDYVGRLGTFDIVYSWGVLHHTGAMWTAVDNAARLVAPGGTLAIALYRKTPMCQAWTWEKRLYARSPKPVQAVLRGAYKAALAASQFPRGGNPVSYIKDYKTNRGMTWHNDVHDWLGGYPYESAAAPDVVERLKALDLNVVRTFVSAPGFGLFGTGCDEFVAQRPA